MRRARRRNMRVSPFLHDLGRSLDRVFVHLAAAEEELCLEGYRPGHSLDPVALAHVSSELGRSLADLSQLVRAGESAHELLRGAYLDDTCRLCRDLAITVNERSERSDAENAYRLIMVESEPLHQIADDVRKLGYVPGEEVSQISPAAARLTRCAVQLLPVSQRPRYFAEFKSELHDLGGISRWAQLLHAARLLKSAWALRRALMAEQYEAVADR